jgi:hypothetical protein
MTNISNLIRTLAVSAVMAISAVAAQAATITIADSGSTYDLLADSYTFDEDFAVGTSGGTLTFDFTNSSASTAAVTFFGFTVNQNLAAFTDGVQVSFGSLAESVGEGCVDGDERCVLCCCWSDRHSEHHLRLRLRPATRLPG